VRLVDSDVAESDPFSIEVPPTFNSGGNVWEFPALFFGFGIDVGGESLFTTGYFTWTVVTK